MNLSEALAAIKRRESQHYVYVLSKPDGTPFYVGIGTNRRIADHEIYARGQRQSHKLATIRKIWSGGGQVGYAIAAWCDDRADAEAAEAALIAKFGRRDLGTGSLTNGTAGGEGAPDKSPAALQRTSDSLTTAWSKRNRVAETAHLRSPDVIRKAAETRMGRPRGKYKPRDPSWITAEFRAAKSEALKKDPVSRRPGVAAKISAALRGRHHPDHWMRTEEGRARFARGKHPKARPIEINGRRFACKADAVEALGISLSTVDYWLKRGRNGARFLSKGEEVIP